MIGSQPVIRAAINPARPIRRPHKPRSTVLRRTLPFSTAPARGSKKNTESCPEFFDDMRRREAAEPLLVVCDGAPGMIRAIDGMPAAHRAL